jgi:transposase
MKKYRVTLTTEERTQLTALLASGTASATKQAHARILLKADESEGGPAWADTRIAEAVEVSVATVERVRERLVEQGLDAALVRKPQARPSRLAKIDGAAEARLVTLACSKPPKGRAAWTMQLLADRLVELQVVESVSDETVRKVLKKTSLSPGNGTSGAGRRRPAANSSRPWRTCWTCTSGPTTRTDRWCAWTRSRCS